MSSAPPADDPSTAADAGASAADAGSELAALLRERGAPLLEGLFSHAPESRERAEAAAAYGFACAVELGLGRESCEVIREFMPLTAVGLIYVPAGILEKPESSRTLEENALVASHQEKGAQLALGAGLPEEACEWIRLSAERFDGGGPNGVAGKAIPLHSRISRAAYACHAALAGAAQGGDAAEALRDAAGSELDPVLADALRVVLGRATSAGT